MKVFHIRFSDGSMDIVKGMLMVRCDKTGQISIYKSNVYDIGDLVCIAPATAYVVIARDA